MYYYAPIVFTKETLKYIKSVLLKCVNLISNYVNSVYAHILRLLVLFGTPACSKTVTADTNT